LQPHQVMLLCFPQIQRMVSTLQGAQHEDLMSCCVTGCSEGLPWL